MDTIFLTDLRVDTIVGVWNWERQMPQTVSIDLEMAADIPAAAAADTLEATLDYKAVSTRVVSLVKESQFKLVETMAEAIAQWLDGHCLGSTRGRSDPCCWAERSGADQIDQRLTRLPGVLAFDP